LKGNVKIKVKVTMALRIRYQGKWLKTVICAVCIFVLTFGTPAAALSLSHYNSGSYHGMSYGYSVNLQSPFTSPVTVTSESTGISLGLFSPIIVESAYQVNYLPVNPGSTQVLLKKLEIEYLVNPQKSIPVPPDYIEPFYSPESLHVATSIDYVDASNQRIHSES
jgi:hypothetical protein